jgi:hypothetical protein
MCTAIDFFIVASVCLITKFGGQSMQSSIKAILDENIAVTGKVVSPTEATDLPGERKLMEFIIWDAEVDGVKLSPVKWDDGVVALVPGDPTDTTAWRTALIKTHRHAVSGVLGPANIGEQK